jgi:hypothetical protein
MMLPTENRGWCGGGQALQVDWWMASRRCWEQTSEVGGEQSPARVVVNRLLHSLGLLHSRD